MKLKSTPKKKTKEQALKSFIVMVLRRASYRWYARTEAVTRARVDRGVYQCAHCKGSFKRTDISVDHIEPVVDVKDSFLGWDVYVERMFCEADGFQVLCKTCHTTKSMLENTQRREYRKLKKEESNE